MVSLQWFFSDRFLCGCASFVCAFHCFAFACEFWLFCGSILSAGSRSELRGVDTRHFEVRRVLLGHRPFDFFKSNLRLPFTPPSGRLSGPSERSHRRMVEQQIEGINNVDLNLHNLEDEFLLLNCKISSPITFLFSLLLLWRLYFEIS